MVTVPWPEPNFACIVPRNRQDGNWHFSQVCEFDEYADIPSDLWIFILSTYLQNI